MQIDQIVEQVCAHYNVSKTGIAKKAHGKSPKLLYGEVIYRLIKGHPNGLEVVFPEVCRTTVTSLLSRIFPGKPLTRVLWSTYLLSTVGYKYCSVCNEIKLIEEYHLAPTRQDGLRSECKICHNRDTANWYHNNPEKAKEYRADYYNLNKEDIKINRAQYYIDNKDKIDYANKAYYEANKDAIAISHKVYYENNKAFYKEYRKEYYLENKAKYLAYDAKRRAAKISATPSWANTEEIYRIYMSRREGEHVDHIIPLQGKSVCGLHCESNLQYLTAKENLEKGNSFDSDNYVHTIEYIPPYVR